MRPGKEVYTTQRIMVGSNRKTIPRLHRIEDIVLVAKCPNCGKTKEEIEKRLKEGKVPSREEVIRRMREIGLDPTKLK